MKVVLLLSPLLWKPKGEIIQNQSYLTQIHLEILDFFFSFFLKLFFMSLLYPGSGLPLKPTSRSYLLIYFKLWKMGDFEEADFFLRGGWNFILSLIETSSHLSGPSFSCLHLSPTPIICPFMHRMWYNKSGSPEIQKPFLFCCMRATPPKVVKRQQGGVEQDTLSSIDLN